MAIDMRQGLMAGFGAYLIWGLLPLYLKLLVGVPAADVLAHRIIWSLLVMAMVTTVSAGWGRFRAALARPRLLALLLGSSVFITCNWLIYTWAILDDHVLDASLGYFINPLISVVFGVVLLGERLSRLQWLAVSCALSGVVVLTVAHGELPVTSLALALSFALYGLIRKQAQVDAVTGLLMETLIIAPVALVWLLTRPSGGFALPMPMLLLLAAGGVLTAVPLLMFGIAARRLKLSTLGLMQYLSPSLVFLLAVFVFHEALDVWRLVAFACIWLGLAIYSLSLTRR
ncbi:EamA family transporter RarD [Polymorphobacter fuscus]|uniref:EamA family transporter RarD n=2 Tax=Sandarakinorhabdus fusca TaxID=1439888 RepID=A0A7C9GYA2_9SPHN|nr:EamA family transporter RarD [Polymorphobacter fuscus]MQT17814.1 EamA family transporter RarD [Polymorphobacter fuscus]